MEAEDLEDDYRAKVRAAIAAMRNKTRMTQEEFALALSEELSRTIRGNKVTQWESGAFLPKSDIFLASMAISGAEPRDLGINPRAILAIRVNQLNRQIRELEADKAGRPMRLPQRLPLAWAEGPAEDYLGIIEAAKQVGVSRHWMYKLMGQGAITGYRLGARTAFRKEEVKALQQMRQKKR